MSAADPGPKTRYVVPEIHLERPQLVVLTGARKGETVTLNAPGTRLTVGSSEDCDIVLPDLQARHVELTLSPDGTGVRVLDRSQGATRVNGSLIHEAMLEPGGTLDLDGVELRLQDGTDRITILPSTEDHFGPARGHSLVMREIFGLLEAIAPTNATVLLLGETGTGKDVLAHATHEASPRAQGPMVTVDCGAIAPTLIEAELFGYERGAFTGADKQRAGALENANEGTLFLDEIGELPLDVQPKLLRAIDEREFQRLGANRMLRADVRIIAATKRDLEQEVKRGRFREDLYFRLAVVPVMLPPLRERRDDIPLLVETFCARFAEHTGHSAQIDPNELGSLNAHDWPGNVRELKNTVERALWLAQTGDGIARFVLPGTDALRPSEGDSPTTSGLTFDTELSFSEHKQQWEKAFELKYLAWLLARADGSISRAARLASMDRKHLRGLLRKHGLAPKVEATKH